MSNLSKSSPVTKLRSNETTINRCRNQRNSDIDLHIHSVPSGPLQNSNPEIISEPLKPKYKGRGMAIQQLAESLSSTERMKNLNMNFSNASIESHFKRLREENAKKLKETNEKIWGKFMHTKKFE